MPRRTFNNPTKIYLAARYSRSAELRRYRDILEEMGHTVTSTWIEGGHEALKEGGPELKAARAEFAYSDIHDLRQADTIICFMEEPRTPTRGGRHVEYGIALERGMELIVIGPKETIFHEIGEVFHYNTWEEFIANLTS